MKLFIANAWFKGIGSFIGGLIYFLYFFKNGEKISWGDLAGLSAFCALGYMIGNLLFSFSTTFSDAEHEGRDMKKEKAENTSDNNQ